MAYQKNNVQCLEPREAGVEQILLFFNHKILFTKHRHLIHMGTLTGGKKFDHANTETQTVLLLRYIQIFIVQHVSDHL